ncbi:hypothetical protein NA56DRAFT_651449 [Hyaloscypha hepaticicola]|uniref:Uncharacterized protein n=1 Tax=Hyaloscypha hepaticicola TaxID=2082293 RepID=A0A2J6PIF0_9HELO|nr:hypothetical protein NA56DRAFT_651449 [Hyaloscypha hepaticicola]
MLIRNAPSRDDYLEDPLRYNFDTRYGIGHVIENMGPAKGFSTGGRRWGNHGRVA